MLTTRGDSRTARRSAVPGLLTAGALMNAAIAVVSPVSTIAAAQWLGTAWGAVPNTAAIVGTGVGAVALSRVIGRWGPRRGLLVGYLCAVAGALIAVPACARGDVGDVVFGMLLLGLGNASAFLSRYAMADLYPSPRRGYAISMLVWAASVGAVGGPLLLTPLVSAATRLGTSAFAGPFAFAAVAAAVAALSLSALPAGGGTPATRVPVRTLLRSPAAAPSLAVMATAQVVMVAIMTAAPLDMHDHGAAFGPVGLTLSAHTLGMFALSPVTGRLVDRFGARPVMGAGLAVLALAAGLAAAGVAGRDPLRQVDLFLLGYAWNLCFVAGSAGLAGELPAAQRARVEGAVDAAVWGMAAVASLASTTLLATGGYRMLAATSGALIAVPALVLALRADWSGSWRGARRAGPDWSEPGSRT
ncbi:MFS transporter [Rugosimonospora africana]|uniref:MFS transporter n=1 Tax=Rugosimonospora africana TaxID=556532 RepID=A0A8J3VR78_9ACTN|nr:MFS transporter [Rugosimonospora africana]GIH15807.1 MFS transporter [Rugosimonospora africana]